MSRDLRVLSGHPSDGAARLARPELTFERVFHEQARFVWRALRRLGVGEADIDDVCQEAFLVVHRKLDTFHGGSSLTTWLYGICIRVASEHRRRPHRRREEMTDTLPETSVPAQQDTALETSRALAQLDAALDALDDDKRAVFVLYEIEQLTMNDVAEAVGCPLQTAYSRLHAARKIVEAALRRGAVSGATPSAAASARRSS